ncbi:MAG: DNA-formamidopyrimidine glycosylase [Cyanothece sp. SIO1E1]|nr:DNA-formamidopyrimidine glycosylase [Cyanothece sp. SIO1E1]
MPELPEVETVRRGLNRVTLNSQILGGDVLLDRTIAHPTFIDEFLLGLKGQEFVQWHRRGKYLLAELRKADLGDNYHAQSGWLGVHLRMTGQLLWQQRDEPLQKHCRVRLWFSENYELRFVDQRTFGRMWWIPPGKSLESIITGLQNLGPEPLATDFSVSYLMQKLKNRHRPIKNALLDQSLVAGIGNIYADEALFLSQIRPVKQCDQLSLKKIKRLHAAIIQVLESSIQVGGTTFSDFRDVKGINGNYGGLAWVYNREGEPCKVC